MDFFVNNAWEILENYLCTPNQLNIYIAIQFYCYFIVKKCVCLKIKVSKIKLELSNHYVPEKAILNTVVDGMYTEE